MTVPALKGVIEAILFVSERPLKITEIAEVLGQDKKEIRAALQELKREYEDGKRGIAIREVGEGYKLFTNPCYTSAVEKFVASSMRGYLTQAALETLSIIAYKQPVTRAQISFIRGVNSDSVVKSLQDKELIAESGRLNVPGNPILYVTTDKFLESMGLRSLKDLPPLEKFELNEEELAEVRSRIYGK